MQRDIKKSRVERLETFYFFFLLCRLAGVGKDGPSGRGVSGLQGRPPRRLSAAVGADRWARYHYLTPLSGLVLSLHFHQLGDF